MKVRAILKDEGQRFEDLHSVAWLQGLFLKKSNLGFWEGGNRENRLAAKQDGTHYRINSTGSNSVDDG